MEAKKRGTFKIDRNLTPKDNINNLLKLAYPVEVTISKMNPQTFAHEGWSSGEKSENVLLQNIDVFPINKYNLRSGCRGWMMGDNPTPQDMFARIGFGLKTNAKHCNRRGRDGYVARWSVPIKDEKVSIGKVVNIFEEMQVITKEISEYSGKREEAERIDTERRKEREDKLKAVKQMGQISRETGTDLSLQGYRDSDNPSLRYRFDAYNLNEAQAIAIGKAVNQILVDPALADKKGEVNE